METLYFILGVLSVVAIAAVVSVFRIKAELKQFTKNEIDKLDELIGRRIVELERDIYRSMDSSTDYIDKIESNLNRHVDDLHSDNNREFDKLYGHLDSRHDKMANNVAEHVAQIYQTIQRLEETIEKSGHSLLSKDKH
jgi:gas vesicle protein